MSNLRQAAEMALEALVLWEDEAPYSWSKADADAVAALRVALAEPNKCTHGVTDGNCKECYMAESEQEPVAWMTHSNDLLPLFHRTERAALMWGAEPTPLYTSPRQRKPLTDDEIEQAYRHIYRNVPDGSYRTTYYWIEQGIRYAEQAHGIKGEA